MGESTTESWDDGMGEPDRFLDVHMADPAKGTLPPKSFVAERGVNDSEETTQDENASTPTRTPSAPRMLDPIDPVEIMPRSARSRSDFVPGPVPPPVTGPTDLFETAPAPGGAGPPSAIGWPHSVNGSDHTGAGFFKPAMLLRFKWMILGIFVPPCVLIIPLIWMFVEPSFQASAAVHVAPVASRIIFETEENTRTAGSLYASFVETQIAIVHSPAVLQRVLEDPEVRQTAWYRESGRGSIKDRLKSVLGSPAPNHLDRLKDELRVERPKRGELIVVSMVDKEAETAALIANTVVDQYVKYYTEDNRRQQIELLAELDEKKTELETLIDGLTKRRATLPSLLGPNEIEELARLEALKGDLKAARDLTEWEVDALSKQTATEDDNADDATREPDSSKWRYLTDPGWQALHDAWLKAQHELDRAKGDYGESHPRIRQLRANADYAEKRQLEREQELDLAHERGQVLGLAGGNDPNDPTASPLTTTLLRQQKELDLLLARIDTQRNRAVSAADIMELDEIIARSRRSLEQVLARKEARETESRAPARVRVQSRAPVPSQPRRDNRLVFTAMTIMASLGMGLGAAFLKVSFNPKVFEADEVERLAGAPFLGYLPRLPRSPDWNVPLPWPLAESLRMIRTSLLQRLQASRAQVVLVTSSTANVGKTTVAIGLAQSLAQLGKKTLLVEADLRKPTVGHVMGIDGRIGLARVLTGEVGQDHAILKNVAPNLDVLPAGEGIEGFDPELLANGVFGGFLKHWKRSYEVILLDSPPVLPVADARILSSHADGTLMVTRASHCRRSDMVQAYADLAAAGGKLLGSILLTELPNQAYTSAYRYYPPGQYGGSKPARELPG